MGWLFSTAWPTASAMRDHLRDELTRSGWTLKGDALTAYGRRYYAVTERDGEPATIFVALLDSHGRDGGWGYKDMDEGMGPYVTDCPLRLLDLAGPPRNETAAKWRDRVRAFHAGRRAGAAVVKVAKKGDKVWLTGRPNPYTVLGRRKSTLIGYRSDGAGPFRLPAKDIERHEAGSPS